MSDDTTNILLFLAQGFEDLEAASILSVFGWTRYRDHIQKATVITSGFHEVVKGRYGLKILPDLVYTEIDPDKFQALVLPGEFHGYGFEEAYDQRIHHIARKIHGNGGFIATMCVGVLPIADSGLLKGKCATTYPYSQNHENVERLRQNFVNVLDDNVIIDNRIISCKGPGSSLHVAFLLMERLMGRETVSEVKKYMIF